MKQREQDPGITAGHHQSIWFDGQEPLAFQPLLEHEETGTVVVGGGIAGLSVAYNLVKNGEKVLLLEDGNLGSGETGRTTAHLVNALDDRYYELQRIFGEDGAKMVAASHSAAIDFIEEACRTENIECGFQRLDGYLFLHPSDKTASLEKELDAARAAGLEVEILDSVPHVRPDPGKCIRFPNQAQFHPIKYLRGLAEAIIRRGGKICTQTHVSKIDSKGVETDKGIRVAAANIVVATNSPVNNKYIMHLKQYPYRTYAIACTIAKGAVEKALWWDTGDFDANADIPPYHYVRVQPYSDEYDLLVSGGEDHPTGMPEAMETSAEKAYRRLEEWTRKYFPIVEVANKWSGQVLEPMDGLAYIGRNPMDSDNVYIVTGDSGNGMTHGSIAGMLISDLIRGVANPWEKIYSPSRLNIFKSGKTFIKEFFGGLIQYLRHSPRNTEKIRLTDIAPGDAEVVSLGKEKYGVYKDDGGSMHVVAATCTHAGCTVKWNPDEKSWDCPCHGSRFTHKGVVINGPAIQDLQYVMEEPREVRAG